MAAGAYRFNGVYSEPFPSHEAAVRVAHRVADEQRIGGQDAPISHQDGEGRWHEERALDGDRPETEIRDSA